MNMKEITELPELMRAIEKGANPWRSSSDFKDKVYWNTTGKEHVPEFPTIYASRALVKEAGGRIEEQMRKAFIQTLTELAEKDPKVILIIGDVGFSFIEPYKERFPNQFLNVGVLEQTMMGVAAGLSRVGWKPYVYTMANFILIRPLEQVRNDIGFGKANVKLFGVKGSEAYKFLGYSHNLYGDEEECLLETIPNLKVYLPYAGRTEESLSADMRREYETNGPAYFSI